MIRIGDLYLFNGHFIATLHWHWSITWRWILTLKRNDSVCRYGFYWLPHLKGWNNWLFDIALHTQDNIERFQYDTYPGTAHPCPDNTEENTI